MIDKPQAKVVGRSALGSRGNRLDAIELTAVGRRVQAHEEGVGEAKCRGETEESCDEKKNLPKSEGLDAD
jgi:hypothetical protein